MDQPGSRKPAPAPLHLIQDLANSFDLEGGRESLVGLHDLDAFARSHGMDGVRFSLEDLDRVRLLRDALRECCIANAGHESDASRFRFLNDTFARAAMSLVIASDAAPALVATDPRSGFDLLATHVQDAIYRADAQGIWPRLKACESEVCRWVYYDNSPSGRSRWCTMSVCGSRAKMRAYRARTDRSRLGSATAST
ncbi:MAG: CGNR zinc finger domain-containing protein [Microbacteriaceae bacterium]